MPKVLLVEDNALNRKMLERRLRHCGYEVLLATDGEQGVTIATDQQPDLVIMDTDLPVMGGWQAIKILKASVVTANIPIIALTTNTKSGNWKTALEVGCNDYDTKPLVLKRLLGKVNTLLGLASSPTTPAEPDPVDVLLSATSSFSMSESTISVPSAQIPTLNKASNGLLNDRYEIGQVLRKDSFGQCLLAKDVKGSGSQSVIINAFDLPVDDPTLLTLVRESLASEMKFLRVISKQDDIATCLDYFEQDETFYWVQDHILGTSLANELGSAQSMGHVLKLTHSLLSSVHPFHQGKMVHCECHPHSFIRRQSDNRIVLVDYGLLKRMFVNLRSHSLTYRQAILKQGQYQPAEQRAGTPQLSSDVYAIGMIVLQSLTGQSPEWLVTASGQRNLTDLVKADSKIVKLFERMVSPNHHVRFKSASEALASLPLSLLPKESTYQQALSS
ncbi:response regulator [Leptothoe spongobia]|uniref:Response regulator n=1 Tax=Leptothoe spongobia TAU-MAC 1115 TaxID=1967444 RepID=A0A947GI86_9CYAN|nr:response regulator [Leptothoe spongobia]MBT9314652.1 response regulator [Leptothoe spongobia TAU-MAC 1115]